MPWNVTVASGLKNVVLPNGLRYSAGESATLSDDEYSTVTEPGSLFSSSVQAGVLSLAASTGPGGFTLVNGTPNILTWTAPGDGALHRFMIFGAMDVTSAETGGLVGVTATYPDGAVAGWTLFADNQVAGANYSGYTAPLITKAGTTVTVQQYTALTAGAAVLWAEIWAL
jgi:hypothetical protein